MEGATNQITFLLLLPVFTLNFSVNWHTLQNYILMSPFRFYHIFFGYCPTLQTTVLYLLLYFILFLL